MDTNVFRYEKLFAAACGSGVQLCRPGVAEQGLHDEWADALGDLLSAVISRLSPQSGTVVGRQRHTTMVVAAFDLMTRAAQLLAYQSGPSGVNGIDENRM